MNAATAGGILGGESSGTFTAGPKGTESGVCQFVRASDHKVTLEIDVVIMKSAKTDHATYVGKCPSEAKPLKAIGNEAVVCTSDSAQRIIGRVRDQAFVITINAPGITPERVRRAAEIVSGNLF